MKKIVYVGFIILMSAKIQFVSAAVSTSCEPGWFGGASDWYSDCWIWVQSEPQILGATQVEAHNYTWGSVYQGGSFYANGSANKYEYDTINHQEVNPDVWVMHAYANARLYAIKYTDAPTNTQGVTWNPLCGRGKYSYYQSGTGWIYDPSFDFEDCSSGLTTE